MTSKGTQVNRILALLTALALMVGWAGVRSGAFKLEAPQTSQAPKIQTPAQRKLDSRLRGALEQSGTAQKTGSPRRPSSVDIDREGKVLIDIQAVVTPEVIAAIEELDGVVVAKFPAYQSLRARLPLSKLETLAERPDIKSLRAAGKAITNSAAPEAR